MTAAREHESRTLVDLQALTASGRVLDAGPNHLSGWRRVLTFISCRETAGAVASFRLRQGGPNGQTIMSFNLAANESAREWAVHPIHCPKDLYVERLSGSFDLLILGEEGLL